MGGPGLKGGTESLTLGILEPGILQVRKRLMLGGPVELSTRITGVFVQTVSGLRVKLACGGVPTLIVLHKVPVQPVLVIMLRQSW